MTSVVSLKEIPNAYSTSFSTTQEKVIMFHLKEREILVTEQ